MINLLVILLFAAAGGFAFVAYRGRGGAKRKSPALSEPNMRDLTIKDAVIGDTVILKGAAEDFEDLHVTIDRIDTYRSGRERWAEVSGVAKNRRVFVEWYEDDVLEVLLNHGERFTLADLNTTEEELARFDEEESTENSVVFAGEPYHYVCSEEVQHSRDGGPEESFYCWDFRGEDSGLVSVEKWEGDPFVATISVPIKPHDVVVFRR